jgi:hypothetical protein
MSRPAKAIIEYFSHTCRHGRVIFVLENLWGNNGYSMFYKIYELLGDSEGHIFDLNKVGNREYLSTYTLLSGDIVNMMLDKLVDLGIIDGELLKKGIIWSQCFVDDLEDVYSRRKINKPIKPVQLDLCIQESCSTGLPKINSHTNPQSKVKESKVKEKTFLSDSVEVGLSEFLFSLMKANNPKAKEPNFQEWARSIDLMIRIDKRDPGEIKNIITWALADTFWHKNILSTAKLREQYDQLVLKSGVSKNKGSGQSVNHAGQPTILGGLVY